VVKPTSVPGGGVSAPRGGKSRGGAAGVRRGVKLTGGARLSVALGGERVREVVAGRRGGFGWAVAGRPILGWTRWIGGSGRLG